MMLNKNSTNDYLERILILHRTKGFARSVDLARELKVSKPTVSDAVKRLRERGLIDIEDKGRIIFTDSGKKIAEKVYKKHRFLKKSLVSIGVKESVADRDACMMGHVISEETYKCLASLFKSYPQVSEN